MSVYAEIDPILNEWAKEKAIFWSTEHQDIEIRSINIFESDKASPQIWIEKESGVVWVVKISLNTVVGAENKSASFSCFEKDLKRQLEEAHNLLLNFVKDKL